MKRSLLLAAALVILTATPALADHGTFDYFYDDGHNLADTWPNSGTETFCIDPAFWDQYQSGAMDTFRTTVELSLNHWRINTDFNRVFASDPGMCPGQADFMAAVASAKQTRNVLLGENWQEEFCQNYLTGSASRIEYENLDPGDSGFTIVCDRNNDEVLDFFVTIIDIKFDDWHFDNSPPTVSHEFSLWSVMTHEAGHVIGWSPEHWTSEAMCPNNGNHHTMCSDSWGYLFNFGGTADATIESHDIFEVNQAY